MSSDPESPNIPHTRWVHGKNPQRNKGLLTDSSRFLWFKNLDTRCQEPCPQNKQVWRHPDWEMPFPLTDSFCWVKTAKDRQQRYKSLLLHTAPSSTKDMRCLGVEDMWIPSHTPVPNSTLVVCHISHCVPPAREMRVWRNCNFFYAYCLFNIRRMEL